MYELLVEPFTLGFMRRAIIEVIVLGVLCGIIGVHVLLRRLAFLTEVVQHAVFPGIAIAFAFGESLLVGALAAAIAAVVLVTMIARVRSLDTDAVMALLISLFLGVGVVVVSRRRGFQSDLTSLLLGRILSVDQRELVDTMIVAAVCLVALAVLHKELVFRSFDPGGADALGLRVQRLDLVLNVVIALAIVAAIRALGTVLVVAFVVTPAATARLLCRRIGSTMIVAATLGALGGWVGLSFSYYGSIHHGWRLAPGATVVLLFTIVFVVVAIAAAATRRGRITPVTG